MRAQSKDKWSEGNWLHVEVAKKVGGGGVRANTWILIASPVRAQSKDKWVA